MEVVLANGLGVCVGVCVRVCQGVCKQEISITDGPRDMVFFPKGPE